MYLRCLTAAYHATPCESTGLSPNMVMLGREVRMPMELTVPENTREKKSYGEYVSDIRASLYKAHEITRKHKMGPQSTKSP